MKYRLTQRAYINDRLLEPGTEIDFDGQPGPHMEPIDSEAKAAMEAYREAYPNATLEPLELLPMTMGGRVADDAGGKWEPIA